jgi:hypothetical protein
MLAKSRRRAMLRLTVWFGNKGKRKTVR